MTHDIGQNQTAISSSLSCRLLWPFSSDKSCHPSSWTVVFLKLPRVTLRLPRTPSGSSGRDGGTGSPLPPLSSLPPASSDGDDPARLQGECLCVTARGERAVSCVMSSSRRQSPSGVCAALSQSLSPRCGRVSLWLVLVRPCVSVGRPGAAAMSGAAAAMSDDRRPATDSIVCRLERRRGRSGSTSGAGRPPPSVAAAAPPTP